MSDPVRIEGQLEVDLERGVIYFHSNEDGSSRLRIQHLPTPIPDPREEMLDLAWPVAASWNVSTPGGPRAAR